jgi:hypothetical protein
MIVETKPKDLSKHEDAIRQIIDSFEKMCDYIETTDKIGCKNCPVFEACFYDKKHEGLLALKNDLDMTKD